MPEHVDLARKLIDIGAESILFHHAHSIQPIEYYKGKLIAYCIGNFIFDDLITARQYNQEGVSNSKYEKSQAPWNRLSLGIIMDPMDYSTSIKKFSFYNEVIKKKRYIKVR